MADVPHARRVFDVLKKNDWDLASEIPVEEVAEAANVRPRLVRRVFATLAAYDYGRLVMGRRGSSTRFVRDEEQTKTAFRHILPSFKPDKEHYAAAAASRVSPLVVSQVPGATSAPLVEWTVSLAGRRKARVLLPEAMTSADVHAMRKFLDGYEAQLLA